MESRRSKCYNASKSSCILKDDAWLEIDGKKFVLKDLSCSVEKSQLNKQLVAWVGSNFNEFNLNLYIKKKKGQHQKDFVFLRQTDLDDIFKLQPDILELTFSPWMSVILGLEDKPKLRKVDLRENSKFVIPGGFNLSKLIPTYYELYTNIIETEYLGKKVSGFFGFVPCKRKDKIYIYEPKHITYHSLDKNEINEVMFKIKTCDGHLLHSYENDFPKITLIFTKII